MVNTLAARRFRRREKSKGTLDRWDRYAGQIVASRSRERVMAMFISGILGASMLAIGSNLVIPVGVEIGSLVDLAGVASMMVFLGLADGK
jgi:hypothetical protein